MLQELERLGQYLWVDKLIKMGMAQQPQISMHSAIEAGMIGPVYHGTNQENRQAISEDGFKIFRGKAQQGPIKNGFMGDINWANTEIPPPVHFLGFGVYFTNNIKIAKKFSGNTARGIKAYYIDAQKTEEINFASPYKMMQWWIDHGYDPEIAKKDQVAATNLMTENLANQFDAVIFKGKGYGGRALIDGNQICVYDPSKIHEINNSLAGPYEVGSSVIRKIDGMVGKIISMHTGMTPAGVHGLGYHLPNGIDITYDQFKIIERKENPTGTIIRIEITDQSSPIFGELFDVSPDSPQSVITEIIETPRPHKGFSISFKKGGTQYISEEKLHQDYEPV